MKCNLQFQPNDNDNIPKKSLGIVIMDHGSRRPEASITLRQLCQRYKSKFQYSIVEPAHMEIAEPNFAQACKTCIDQGATEILCHPYFLSQGRHVHEDIPKIIQDTQLLYPNIPISMTPPLGGNEDIIDIIQTTISKHLVNSNNHT